jgi:hypothetical protein
MGLEIPGVAEIVETESRLFSKALVIRSMPVSVTVKRKAWCLRRAVVVYERSTGDTSGFADK